MSLEDPFNTPEKKYKRDQWFIFASNRLQKKNSDFINYCTFPGKSCLDVFRLKPLLKTTATGYHEDSLTFFEKDQETIVDIWNLLPGANHYQGYFEEFIMAAWKNKEIRPDPNSEKINPLDYFPYDVINLDYTGPAFKHEGKKTSAEMNAIYKLFEIQGFKHNSFTLFLTFPAVKSWDDIQGKTSLNECIVRTLGEGQNVEFKSQFERLYPRTTPPFFSNGSRSTLNYKQFLLLGIPITIINYGFQNKFDVKCKRRYLYVGEGNNTPMVSFIFDCEFLGSEIYGGTVNAELTRLRPIRLNEIYTHFENINDLFEANLELRSRYSTD